MGEKLRPVRVASPGHLIEHELEARGWTQADLAAMMDCPEETIDAILRATGPVTPEIAVKLAEAFGTSPELWLNLETNYRLHLAREGMTEVS